MITPVIMAGGTGSRLWPLSRELYPKQFLTVTGEQSMLQQTVARLSGIEHVAPVLICNEEHRFIAAEQMRLGGYAHSGIILEPVGRNTAPAIALSALQAVSNATDNEDPILLVLAADHIIKNEQAFKKSVEKALPFAEADQLVTFGIVPTAPETGYGYIKSGSQEGDAFSVSEFVEKPNLETAQEYLASGNYYWNSGMFLFKASRYLEELAKFAPEMLDVCKRAIATPLEDVEFIRVDKDIFATCPDDSIDYAVMEKCQNVVVVPIDAGWSDVGSFSALWEVSEKDGNQNAIKGDVITTDSTSNYIYAENKLVTTVGVDNLVIVETKDAILVAKKDKVQDVKTIVNKLKEAGRTEQKLHREVYRPWGKYDSIDFGKRDQVKRITVKPGEKLSIQKHFHRSEHWIVVSGTASVLNGDKTIIVTENESTYIPLGTIHALENPGKIPLEMIEVQTGSYLGEDDIVRFEDRYGRV
ncbi:mannose-1-phosphate guanylyltransferase/mannose-6-phosphate isomerase [Vibrio sp. 10N.286.55.E10]|uniref:mannose-1-phosphate guanylyltransferase/mannose-6-phosphate isomerase n=1 Tax=unclassified Vibrio TaxID=2614977 RepID=UPI000C8554B3|nr:MULTISPECIES: mannose-1-phosphate guanylyltransferase/mannose-6-phosphate isomerase [unclassified Vibrio]PME35515.1 mannose-1-phosphate guanylyltransferase/mannose-6-phosphate isomerase [Vibrio sp. 10N.286.55.E10]PME40625.1 mannose-1-phosphate guanylyltransferase/mannose-6-phosphate isomerase [Vibrio sp. 10N.286.55.E12]PME66460.1 mannose-1-phosphate guanylyltransferase/mannose-6-phosphate isomerase [Vibrio sp. 10N.286.55.C11]